MNPTLGFEIWYNRLLESSTKIKSSHTEYKILSHLGSSGNGEIFIAITSNNFIVGLKIILQNTNYCKKNTTPTHIEREVDIIRSSTKKVEDILLPFIDYFILEDESDKFYVIVFKYFEGYISLSKYLEKNLFQAELKSNIGKIITKHMEMIHNKLNISHQDINMNNILIHCKTMHIRFFDLGYCIEKFGYSNEEFLKFTHKDFDSIEKI